MLLNSSLVDTVSEAFDTIVECFDICAGEWKALLAKLDGLQVRSDVRGSCASQAAESLAHRLHACRPNKIHRNERWNKTPICIFFRPLPHRIAQRWSMSFSLPKSCSPPPPHLHVASPKSISNGQKLSLRAQRVRMR